MGQVNGLSPRFAKRKKGIQQYKTEKEMRLFSVVLNGEFANTKFRQRTFFSADLWYNGANGKPPSEREGDRVSGGRSLRDFRFG